MKKLILTIALFCICVLSYAGPGLGIKAGANFSNQSAKLLDIDLSTSGITGFVGGVYAHWFFGDKIAIQPELLYARKGAKTDDSQLPSSSTAKLDYFDIPIVVKWQIIKFLNIHAGPQFSILTKAVAEDENESYDIKEDLKNSDLGLIVGAEANLPLRLNLTARYIFGLKDISEIDELKLKNSTFQLTLGIRLIGN